MTTERDRSAAPDLPAIRARLTEYRELHGFLYKYKGDGGRAYVQDIPALLDYCAALEAATVRLLRWSDGYFTYYRDTERRELMVGCIGCSRTCKDDALDPAVPTHYPDCALVALRALLPPVPAAHEEGR